MDLLKFLSPNTVLTNSHVYCLVSSRYSSFFYPIIKQVFQKELPIISIDTIETEAALKASLEISLLGSKVAYWISSSLIETYPSLIPYLAHYRGPHTIIFFNSKPIDAVTIAPIEFPAEIDYLLFSQLFTFLYPLQAKTKTDIFKAIFKKHTTLPFDTAYLLMHYSILVGNNSDAFIKDWLPLLIIPEKSLFTLSSHFFAKKEHLFFELWNAIASDYGEPFWLTFWSDQLFKAHAFITYTLNNNYIQAKRIAYRLPFSFMQKDWRSLSALELKNAHDYLYTVDWNIKNGLSNNLEHFYIQFFLGTFKR